MKTVHKDYWGRYTSATTGKEARVHAKSVELRYIDSGMTTQCTVTDFKYGSPIRWEAMLEAVNLPPPKNVFTKYTPFQQEEEQTAIEWPDPRVGKLVMVEKYNTDTDDDTTLIIFAIVVISFLVLFNK